MRALNTSQAPHHSGPPPHCAPPAWGIHTEETAYVGKVSLFQPGSLLGPFQGKRHCNEGPQHFAGTTSIRTPPHCALLTWGIHTGEVAYVGKVRLLQPGSLLGPFQGKRHRKEHPQDHETPCGCDGRVPDNSPGSTAPLGTAEQHKAVKKKNRYIFPANSGLIRCLVPLREAHLTYELLLDWQHHVYCG